MGFEMEVKDSSYWDAFDDALDCRAESEREQYYKELDETEELERKEEERKLKEADAALRTRRESTRLIDTSGDDSSLDSRFS